MKNYNTNFEQEFKNQLDEREILPSRDLWFEIESQTTNKAPKKNKVNTYLLAACLVLFFSLTVVLLFNNEEKTQSQIAKENIQPQNSIQKSLEIKNTQKDIEKTNEILTKRENKISFTEKSKSVEPHIVHEDKNSLHLNQNIKSEYTKPQLTISKSYANIDSTAFPKKNKKYVDASTLLFSVEHKDLIEKTKEGKDVATIDLNSK